ncbi:iron ABC transporter permease [Alsobacter sp. SYSU M60028]|uniref:Iron ABC transporter permease n=1 Tax=Alsobacter ponti TaxID=2962936 RepID=A0ABT1LHY6_9HYPH|nr:iron ABC transporter permease [Alsobacter ponti]
MSLALIALGGDASTLEHVARNVLPDAMAQTAMLLAGVAVLVSVVGVGTAWLVTAYRFPGRGALAMALILPLAMPAYIVAYVYVEILEPLGPVQGGLRALFGWRSRADYWFPEIRSLPGAVLVLGFVLYPYVYMTARALFSVQSANLIEVARTLGARPWELFRAVALPLARPALALGLSLALLETLNDIGASEYLGVRTLTVSIYTTWVNRNSLEGAAQIACVMLAVVAVILWLERRARGARGFTASVKRPRQATPLALSGGAGFAAALACALPVVVGFAIPAALLVREAVSRTLRKGVPAEFWHALGLTLAYAAAATCLVLVLGAVVAAAVRMVRGRKVAALARVASLGYAMPGTVLAVGLLTPLATVDNALANAIRAMTGVSPGLILTGSGAAVVVAYTVRFLGIAAGGIESGMSRISTHMDDAARTLGRRPGEILRLIHLPLARPALASAALLVFVDAMKELPATLLLRPLNADTLATAVYAQAARGVFEDGALAALAIVLAGLAPVLLMLRLSAPGGQRGPAEPAEAFALEDPSGLAPR